VNRGANRRLPLPAVARRVTRVSTRGTRRSNEGCDLFLFWRSELPATWKGSDRSDWSSERDSEFRRHRRAREHRQVVGKVAADRICTWRDSDPSPAAWLPRIMDSRSAGRLSWLTSRRLIPGASQRTGRRPALFRRGLRCRGRQQLCLWPALPRARLGPASNRGTHAVRVPLRLPFDGFG
jgi:hypothetical protein